MLGCQAVIYSIGLLLATGLVPYWAAWYSTSLPYRTQTEALLKGDLAVSRSVGDLKFDHTWSEQGVHQVWGLGVPLWRLPFEAVAKWFGFNGFPDRLAFGLFALIVSFMVLNGWAHFGDAKWGREDRGKSGWSLITGFGAGLLILLLFPPFLTLLQVRGAVWEEAVAYEYLFAVLEVSLLLAFIRRPSAARLCLVSALAGLGGLIRPSLVFYGFATLVIASVVWVVHVRQGFQPVLSTSGNRSDKAPTLTRRESRWQTCPILTRVLAPVLFGLFLFCLGGGVLWFTNLKRFGDGFEFGHKLNVQYLYGSMYATRFDHPFENETLTGAAGELCGALFCAQKLNGQNWYQEHIFSGQSKTVRWREFYFRTFDWTYPPLLLLGWGAALIGTLRFRVLGFALGRWGLGDRRSEIGQGHVRSLWDRPSAEPTGAWGESIDYIIILGCWSLLSVIPLAGFYLYAPVISSRYMMDFAPAFAAALAAAWLFIGSRCEKRWSCVLVCALLCTWLGTQLYLTRSTYDGPDSVPAAELKVLCERSATIDRTATNSNSTDAQSLGGQHSAIPFDRQGWSWNDETGAVMPLVILFVKDPEFLEFEFTTHPHPCITAKPEDIRAKVGLESLERVQITKTADGWRTRFRGPQQPRWRHGLQSAFVATVPKEFLAERTTPWILKSVRWRAAAEDSTYHR